MPSQINRDWESVFSTWSQGPSQTEQERADNAEKMIRSAIESSSNLNTHDIRVFTHGSYHNRVNVRRDSDVDICVLCLDSYYPEYSNDNIKDVVEKKEVKATYTYRTFKNELEEALLAKFGQESVSRGNKAFNVHENTYRVESDVAAFFEYRLYTSETNYDSGVVMFPDALYPELIVNWPEQHYNNGVAKNNRTSRRYKRTVRILKSLSNEMCENDIISAINTPGFLIECLVWNVPDDNFDSSTFKPMVRSVLAWLFNNTISDDQCSDWGEVSDFKYLFNSFQNWDRTRAHSFLSDAWDYMGYK